MQEKMSEVMSQPATPEIENLHEPLKDQCSRGLLLKNNNLRYYKLSSTAGGQKFRRLVKPGFFFGVYQKIPGEKNSRKIDQKLKDLSPENSSNRKS